MSVCSSIIGFILCVGGREVPTKMPPRLVGFAKPPALYCLI